MTERPKQPKAKKRHPEYFAPRDLDEYVRREAESSGKSRAEILEETFHDGYVVISESGDGAFKVEGGQLFKPASEKIDDLTECRRLRERFGPIAACVEYIKDIILGSGIDITLDNITDPHQKEVKKELERWMNDVYQDAYTIGLNTLLNILVDNALTEGFAAAEIVYEEEKGDMFQKYAKPVTSSVISQEGGKLAKSDYTSYEITDPVWSELKGIARLKIFLDAPTRFRLYRRGNTWEADYWVLDQPATANAQGGMVSATQKNLQQGVPMQISTQELIASTMPNVGKTNVVAKPSAYFLPWQIFSLSITRRTWLEKGPSIILPAMKTAQLLEKIMNAVGEGIYRAGNKKYFIVCGTKDRAWGAIHIRNLLSQIKDASEKNWSTIPVPAGFDLKEAGGNVFEAQNAINYFLRVIAGIMHVNPSVMGLDTREARNITEFPYFPHERLKQELLSQIRTQLIRLHMWTKYGEKKQKQGGFSEPQWIPQIRSKTEDLLNPADRLKLDIDILNAANPVMPQTKLEVERDIIRTRGWEVILPDQEEFVADLKKQQDADEAFKKKLQEQQLANGEAKPEAKKDKEMGPPSPPSEEKQQKRQEAGVNSKNVGGKGNQDRGSTRKPAEVAETLASSMFPVGNFKDMEIPMGIQEGTTFEVPSPIPDQKITVVIQKLKGFVAGYDDNLSKIYIDPAISVEDMKPIISREIFEFGLERILNLSYDESENMADRWEKYVCSQLGIKWSMHQSRFEEALRIVNSRTEKVDNPTDIVRFAKPKRATSERIYEKEESKHESQSPQKVDVNITVKAEKPEPSEITIKTEPIKTEKQEIEIKTQKQEVEVILKEDPEKKKADDELREKKKKLLDNMEKKLEEE